MNVQVKNYQALETENNSENKQGIIDPFFISTECWIMNSANE